MTRRSTDAHLPRSSAQTPAHAAETERLAVLRNWREGTAATAILIVALLPFAISWRVPFLAAMCAALAGATVLALGCHLARQKRLTSLATNPQFARHPDLARTHRRLVSARSRRALALGLRRTATPPTQPDRFDCCPVLHDRVAAVRTELLEIASALEHDPAPDPLCVALLHELLTNACSPLYNTNAPAADLHTTLRRAREGLRP